jgi:hypothetical protein
VLFADRVRRPAVWAVKLGDNEITVLQFHLIDAVLVAVRASRPPVGSNPTDSRAPRITSGLSAA